MKTLNLAVDTLTLPESEMRAYFKATAFASDVAFFLRTQAQWLDLSGQRDGTQALLDIALTGKKTPALKLAFRNLQNAWRTWAMTQERDRVRPVVELAA